MHHLQTITTIATTIVVDAAGRDRNTRHLCDRSERISSEYKYIRFYWSVAFNLAHAQLAGSSLLLANAPLDVCNNRWLLSLSTLRCLSLYIFFVCAKCSACRHRRRHRRNRLHHFSVIFVFLCCFFFYFAYLSVLNGRRAYGSASASGSGLLWYIHCSAESPERSIDIYGCARVRTKTPILWIWDRMDSESW